MTRDDKLKAAYATIRAEDAPLSKRLEAHGEILKYGAPGVGEIAKQDLMAEALSDICIALTRIGAR